MVRRGVQMMYLTATLAPVDMPEFMEKLEEYLAPAKIIIYSSSIVAIKALGEELGYPTYYANVGSEAEKKQILGPGRQEALRQHYERVQQQGVVPQVAITKEDKKRAEQDKVGRFISSARCRRVHLDQAMDDRFNWARCEEGEEVCDLCGKEDAIVGEADVLQEAYNVKQGQGEEGRQDSGIYSSGSPVASAHYYGRAICIPSTAGRARAVSDMHLVLDAAGELGDIGISGAVGGFNIIREGEDEMGASIIDEMKRQGINERDE
ncbi:hypothetical protein V498_08293, partial [Pseudogymnoascus sp. VKM F-4517 (FW-2822)]